MRRQIAFFFTFTFTLALMLGACEVAPGMGGGGLIGDWVWQDDGNGRQDPDEIGLPDVEVRLYAEEEGAEPIEVTQTDADGYYAFEDLPPGTYWLEFVPPDGWGLVEPDRAQEDLDSDPDPATRLTESFELTGGEEDANWDAGMVSRVSQAATATPVVAPTKTPIGEVTETPTPAVLVGPPHFGDPVGDVLDCARDETASEQDQAADIVDVTLDAREDGSLVVEVFLLQPLQDPRTDYSFAVVLAITVEGGETITYTWEWHDAVFSPRPAEGPEWTTLEGPTGPIPGARFTVPAEVIQGRAVKKAAVEVYHMATPDSLWVCDRFQFSP